MHGHHAHLVLLDWKRNLAASAGQRVGTMFDKQAAQEALAEHNARIQQAETRRSGGLQGTQVKRRGDDARAQAVAARTASRVLQSLDTKVCFPLSCHC